MLEIPINAIVFSDLISKADNHLIQSKSSWQLRPVAGLFASGLH
jgi:hypothetical protein